MKSLRRVWTVYVELKYISLSPQQIKTFPNLEGVVYILNNDYSHLTFLWAGQSRINPGGSRPTILVEV